MSDLNDIEKNKKSEYNKKYYEKSKESRDILKVFEKAQSLLHYDNSMSDLHKKIFNNHILRLKDDCMAAKFLEKMEKSSAYDTWKKELKEEREKKISEIKEKIINLCKDLSKKREKADLDTNIYILECENDVIYIGITNDNLDNIIKNHKDRKIKTYATIICEPKILLGNFKGSEQDMENLAKYLEKYTQDKLPEITYMYGSSYKIKNCDLLDDEKALYDKLIEKKYPEKEPLKKEKGKGKSKDNIALKSN
jgi:hypothetical protein